MNFTDLFIKRPVLSTVVSLAILVLGLRSINLLPVREYPETQNAVITVMTVYTGADPSLVSLYSSRLGGGYSSLDPKHYTLSASSVVIPAGHAASTDSIEASLKSYLTAVSAARAAALDAAA